MPGQFITSTFPTLNWWGRIRNLVLGKPGKFSRPISFSLLNKKEILMDVDGPGALMELAMTVPHLNNVITTGAELFSMMNIKHLNSKGEEITNSPILKLLRNPNPLQNQEQYLYEFYVLNGVYRKTFQYFIRGLSYELPSVMWLLPSGFMKIIPTGFIYRQSKIEDIIKEYEFIWTEKKETFEVKDVLYMAEGIGNSPIEPVSSVEALQIPLSNIMASLKSRNIIVSERGMIGFIAADTNGKSDDGPLPPTSDELTRMRKEYQDRYSLDSNVGHVSFTTAGVKWVPMTFDISQLGLLEGVEDDFATICAAFRHDRDLYPSVKGATYENKAAGMKLTVQNALQPLADKLMRQLSKRLLNEKSGETLVASYEHLPCMKEDERLAAQGKLYKAQATDILLRNGTINHEQNALLNEVEADGDKQFQQSAAPSKPAADETK